MGYFPGSAAAQAATALKPRPAKVPAPPPDEDPRRADDPVEPQEIVCDGKGELLRAAVGGP
eukprot:8688886-Lingulodinium_polyedra.AAC.1